MCKLVPLMANTGRSAETVNLKTKQVNDLNILLSASVAEPVCFLTGSGFFRLLLIKKVGFHLDLPNL